MLDNILFRVECVLLPVMVNMLTVLFLTVSYFVYYESVSGNTNPNDAKTRGYQSCFSNPPAYTDLIPSSTQLIEISDGPNLTIGPSFSCAAWIVRLFRLVNRLQSIHTGEKEALQCTLGIFDSGERNAG